MYDIYTPTHSDAVWADQFTDFITIPVMFYLVVAIARLDLSVLRHEGWLFEMNTAEEPWYKFYTFYGKLRISLLRFLDLSFTSH